MSVPLTVSSSSPQHGTDMPSKQAPAATLGAGDLLLQLQNAISNGEEERAQTLALFLAKQKTKVSISPETTSPQKDRVIRVKIYVEDRKRTGSFIFMNLNPGMKFEELKKKMLIEYGFPPEVQVWIVGQRIARDTDTLDKREINKPGASMHLYLRSAESVGLTPHDYRIKYGHMFPADLVFGNQPAASTEATRIQQSAAAVSTVSPSYPAKEVLRPLGAEANPMAKYEKPTPRTPASQLRTAQSRERQTKNIEEISRQSGWACPACTYINIPTRPGCEICGHDRPATYRVPEKLELPQSERLRLDREREYERMMQELQAVQTRELEVRQTTSPFGGGGVSRDVETERKRLQRRREEELHTMLQLNDQINSYRTRYPTGDLPRDVLEDICRLETQMDEGIKVLRRLQLQEEDVQRSGAPRQVRMRYGERGDGAENSDSDSDEGRQAREVHVYMGQDSVDTPQITIGDGTVTYIGRNEPHETEGDQD